jgi:hypothetical protein
VSIASLRLYLEQHPPDGYFAAGDELISDKVLREIEGILPKTMPYAEAVAAIKKKGVSSADAVIKKLGYTVKWSGLDPDSAVLSKVKKHL